MNAPETSAQPDAITPPLHWLRPRPGVPAICAGLGLVLIVAGLALPVYNDTCGKSNLSMSLSQTKQIGLALKLYAGDHNGMYPSGLDPEGEPIGNANQAFRCLFPSYLTTERFFGNPLSAYQTRPPDNVIEPKARILEAGENSYSYISGLRDSDNPLLPLVVDGTDGTGRGLYVSDPHLRGGVWKGERAIFLYLDNSATLKRLTGPVNARFALGIDSEGTYNLLAADRLGPNGELLEPAFKTH